MGFDKGSKMCLHSGKRRKIESDDKKCTWLARLENYHINLAVFSGPRRLPAKRSALMIYDIDIRYIYIYIWY